MQETGTLDTDVSKLGMSAGSNTLGKITATAGTSDANSTLEFEFNNTSSIENKKITLERTANGWTCTQDSGITIKGCS
ncbi:pilin [Photobacterium sp. SKA34]|uniref:pilin n=1 Tax=Photobacterium sp. SKA34 TaxID=121723 RepID=UPI00350F31CE